MRRVIATALMIGVAALAGLSAQASPLVRDVRAAIAASDFALAGKTLAAYRAANGVTPDMLEALSWMGRGALAAKDLDNAEKYARETYELSTAQLKARPLDREPRLPIALGAAIEVLAQTDAARGARTEAVSFLRRELALTQARRSRNGFTRTSICSASKGSPCRPLTCLSTSDPSHQR